MILRSLFLLTLAAGLTGCGEDVCVLGVGDCSEADTELRISAPDNTVPKGSTLEFSATGGSEPRVFTIVAASPTDFGSIDQVTGVYTPGDGTGVVCIRVTDANGATDDLCITVTSS